MQNKDRPKDLNDPHHIDPSHIGYDAKMADEAHDGIDTYDSEVDDDDHDGGDDDEEVVGSI